jgi:hypothetical protein
MKKIIAIVAVILVVGAAGFLFYIKQSKNIEVDSAAVEARGAAMWPGARPPKGLKGVLAISPEEGIEAVIFAPSFSKVKPDNLEGSDLRIVLAQPQGEDPSMAEIKTKITEARGRKDEEMETLEEKPTLLQIGGQAYPGIDSSVEMRESGKKLHENVTLLKTDKQVTVILIIGPEESFNTALRDEFLSALEAPDMTGMTDKLPGGLKMPDMESTPAIKKPERPKRPRRGPPGAPGGG